MIPNELGGGCIRPGRLGGYTGLRPLLFDQRFRLCAGMGEPGASRMPLSWIGYLVLT